ncbi:hypothetical protein ACSFB2_13610, partial [Glaesserella parasuis]|uniref:hypothetical protein n=1 Tax=Glaesserella parasuis TaxID=738 RepID=UPI003F3E4888
YIVGDYVQIFPSDIPVMQYFQNQSYEIWNVLIKPYYRELANQQAVSNYPGEVKGSSQSPTALSLAAAINPLASSSTSQNNSSSSSTFLSLLE